MDFCASFHFIPRGYLVNFDKNKDMSIGNRKPNGDGYSNVLHYVLLLFLKSFVNCELMTRPPTTTAQ